MSTVLVETAAPRVKLLRLNRPERLNAMSVELCLDLEAALDEVGRDNACSVVVLTGDGRAFCSGLDLKDHGVIPNIAGLTAPRIAPRAMRVYSQLVPALRADAAADHRRRERRRPTAAASASRSPRTSGSPRSPRSSTARAS